MHPSPRCELHFYEQYILPIIVGIFLLHVMHRKIHMLGYEFGFEFLVSLMQSKLCRSCPHHIKGL
jgi:hypothetical protein